MSNKFGCFMYNFQNIRVKNESLLNSQWAVINDNRLELNLCIQSDHLDLPHRRICLQCRRPRFDPWLAKIPRKRERQPISVFLLGEFHGSHRVRHTWATTTPTHKASQLWWSSIRIYHHDWFSLRGAEYYLQLLSSLSFLISIGKKKWSDIVISTWKIPLRSKIY